jgi:hypothetical protein
MERGLSSKSLLTQVKAIMGIDTVAQIYLILRDFPAVNEHYEITWDHKIEYTLKPLVSHDGAVIETTDNNNQDDDQEGQKMSTPCLVTYKV